MGEGRKWFFMGPQMEVSRSVRGHKYHSPRALPLFFSATALCASLRQDEAWSSGESKGASVPEQGGL